MTRRSDRAGAQSHLAAATGGDRHRRPADAGRCRQRAAALYDREAQPAPAADPRCGSGRRRRFAALLEKDPPYGARVAFEPESSAAGWNAPGPVAVARAVARAQPPSSPSARRRPTWAKAAASRSWRCSARNFRRRSSSSPACSDRTPTRTARTNSCTSRPPGAVSLVIAQVLADHAARSAGRYSRTSVSAGFRLWRPEPRAFGGRRADVIALQIADPLGAQQGRVFGALDALGDRAQAETLGEAEQVTQKDPIFGAVREVSDKRAVDLDVSTAKLCRCRSEVCPAPKSSSATRQPASRSVSTNRAVSSMS